MLIIIPHHRFEITYRVPSFYISVQFSFLIQGIEVLVDSDTVHHYFIMSLMRKDRNTLFSDCQCKYSLPIVLSFSTVKYTGDLRCEDLLHNLMISDISGD